MPTLGSRSSGFRVHSNTPVTVARMTPASSGARSASFSSAASGFAAPSALSRGRHRDSSSVRKPVFGTVCSSNQRNRACPRLCAKRNRSSFVIFRFEAPTRR